MSRFTAIWGWATWKRVWQTYELDTRKLPKSLFFDKLLKNYSKPIYRHYKRIYKRMEKYAVDTWDYQLFFNLVLNDRYSIIPFVPLTENIGFGTNEAAHKTDSENTYIKRLINHHSKSIYPLRCPKTIYENKEADEMYAMFAGWKQKALFMRILGKLLREVKRFLK